MSFNNLPVQLPDKILIFYDFYYSRLWLNQTPTTRLNKQTQIELFETLIQFEDVAQQNYTATFNRKNIRIMHEYDRFYYFLVTVILFKNKHHLNI